MIGVPRGVQVYAYGEPCDMRKSFNTLAAVVTEVLKKDVLEGDVFLFVGRDRERTTFYIQNEVGEALVSLAPTVRQARHSRAPCPRRRQRIRPHQAGGRHIARVAVLDAGALDMLENGARRARSVHRCAQRACSDSERDAG